MAPRKSQPHHSSDRPLQAKLLQVLCWGLFFAFETENHTVIFRLRQRDVCRILIGREDEVFVNNTNVGACTQDPAETLLLVCLCL